MTGLGAGEWISADAPAHMPLLGGGTRLQPLWIEDLAACLAMAVRAPSWDGHALDLGGPEQLTFSEMLDLIMETTGRRRPKVPLPLPMARVQARLMTVLPNPPLVPARLNGLHLRNHLNCAGSKIRVSLFEAFLLNAYRMAIGVNCSIAQQRLRDLERQVR